MTEDERTAIGALVGPIMVLGAGGFVGSNLVSWLRAERDDVVAVAHSRGSWRLDDLPASALRVVDVTSQAAVEKLLDELMPQTVFDCTAYGGYSSQRDYQRIYKVNFAGVVTLVEALAERGFTAYVHAGSSSEYGDAAAGPSEDSLLQPNSHYAVSKAAAAEYLHYCGAMRGLPVVNLRLYSVYGPMEDPTRLIPTLLSAVERGHAPRLSSPDAVRDFVHVDDVCHAFVRAAQHMSSRIFGASLNIGTGVETSVRQTVEIARDAFGVGQDPEFGVIQAKPWEVAHWFADPSRSAAEIDWTPRTMVREGLIRTMDWRRDHPTADARHAETRLGAAPMPSVSAVIACYNEGPAVEVVHERLTKTFQQIGCDYEIVFVNNGSTDGTDDVLTSISAADPHVVGVTHSRSFGSQMAFRSGMEVSTKDSVVILDGDLQDPPELIAEMYARMLEGYDVVYGRRVKREMSRWVEAPYRVFYRVFQASSDIDIPRDAGDFSLMSRRVVDWMLESPERDLFIRGIRAYVGFKQIGVDYVRPDRLFGHSSNNLRKNIGWAKKAIFAYSRKPLDLLTSAGMVLSALSVLFIIFQIVAKILFPESAPRGITTVLLSVFFFGSVSILGIGILGEYIGKILEEVKARPRYIRSAIIRHGDVAPLGAPRGDRNLVPRNPGLDTEDGARTQSTPSRGGSH